MLLVAQRVHRLPETVMLERHQLTIRGKTAQRLLFTGVLCGLMSPVSHHAFMWVQTGLVDWTALLAMATGDIVGILVVLYIAKGLLTLTDPRDVDAHLR